MNRNTYTKFTLSLTIFVALGLLLLALFSPAGIALAAEHAPGCTACHLNKTTGFSDKHAFASSNCTICHRGDDTEDSLPQAHESMIAYPGDIEHATTACASCHEKRVHDVNHSLMNTGRGMISKTRDAFGQQLPDNDNSIATLGREPADSLLRKLCVSCHLGNSRTTHKIDVTRDRGGGCSACHINSYPENAHPALTSRVEDGRCFGCHSRSGRISLNYPGLAEVMNSTHEDLDRDNIMTLVDGRTVIRRPADIHHAAGMSCIDCHTSTGLMGGGDNSLYQQQAVDIQCSDCHRNKQGATSLSRWPDKHAGLMQYVDPDTTDRLTFPVTTRNDTPLWHMSISAENEVVLQPKLGGPALVVPQYQSSSHPYKKEHARLDCAACHSQWAPQCYGCHIEYDEQGRQYDYQLKQNTRGRWMEQRWDIRSGPPPLGVTEENRIRPFVPGMIMTIVHPHWNAKKFSRQFAAAMPHTTGKARSCASCHRSSTALGMGKGKLQKDDGAWKFTAEKSRLSDGLPADAWTSLGQTPRGVRNRNGNRPFNPEELARILDADVPGDRINP